MRVLWLTILLACSNGDRFVSGDAGPEASNPNVATVQISVIE